MTNDADILTIAKRYILDLRQHGKYWIGFCPNCLRPNLTISPKYNKFCCFACSVGGDAQKLQELINEL